MNLRLFLVQIRKSSPTPLYQDLRPKFQNNIFKLKTTGLGTNFNKAPSWRIRRVQNERLICGLGVFLKFFFSKFPILFYFMDDLIVYFSNQFPWIFTNLIYSFWSFFLSTLHLQHHQRQIGKMTLSYNIIYRVFKFC